jgi:hypothetical protein
MRSDVEDELVAVDGEDGDRKPLLKPQKASAPPKAAPTALL